MMEKGLRRDHHIPHAPVVGVVPQINGDAAAAAHDDDVGCKFQ